MKHLLIAKVSGCLRSAFEVEEEALYRYTLDSQLASSCSFLISTLSNSMNEIIRNR